jgi:exo-1,4-beta-D-glucosaminidase
MFEAYSRNKYASGGVIQWMLNNAWPSLIWHLYDFYLRPGGGYFAAKTAMQPLNPLYGYDDRSIYVINSRYSDAKTVRISTKVLNLDMTEKFSNESTVDVPSDGVVKVVSLPEITDLSPTYFVALKASDTSGKTVASNFYWLSSKPETLDWAKSTWFNTPTPSYADYTALSQLPKVKLNVSHRSERNRDREITHVTVENPSKNLAFFVRLKLKKGAAGQEILPVLWQDNYISLLPGEKRELTADYRATELGAEKPVIEVKGWNTQ